MTKRNGDELVRRPGTALMKRASEYTTSRTDIAESPEAFILRMDMPGARRDSLHVVLDGDLLSITGSTHLRSGNGGKILIREISPATYYRMFHVGQGVEREGIMAEYDEGVLTIHLPKAQNAAKREIHIQ